MSSQFSRLLVLVLAASGLLALPPAASATVVFFDSFDTEALELNTTLDNWTVTNGTIDVVGLITYPTLCAGGPSPTACVDLDGSSSDAGTITHTQAVAAGDYRLSYWLRGNARPEYPTRGPDTVVITLDTSNGGHTLPYDEPWTEYSLLLTGYAGGNLSIVFDHAGGDNVGLLLDDVKLEAVPEPGTLLLLGSGISALALRRRRKS